MLGLEFVYTYGTMVSVLLSAPQRPEDLVAFAEAVARNLP